MATPLVVIAIADPERADDVALELEEHGFRVVLGGDAASEADFIVAETAADATCLTIGRAGHAPSGRLPANAAAALVAACVRLAAAGYSFAPEGSGAPALASTIHLTARERQVLGLLADGAPNKVIARALDISVHTAKFHVAALIDKLGAQNRTEAIAIAIRDGLVFQ